MQCEIQITHLLDTSRPSDDIHRVQRIDIKFDIRKVSSDPLLLEVDVRLELRLDMLWHACRVEGLDELICHGPDVLKVVICPVPVLREDVFEERKHLVQEREDLLAVP